jgi:repressor LexA
VNARKPLTGRQREALDFIAAHIEEHGWAPTHREIGEAMGINSTNGVNTHVKALDRKGYLVREPGKGRAMRLVDWPVAS